MKVDTHHRRVRPISILLVCLLSVVFLSTCRDVCKPMDDYLKSAHDLWGFEGTALVAYDGRVILSRGYGMANQQLNIPNTSSTKFFIGSITKQFTASTILMLEEQGLLSVNDPIAKYLPKYPSA